MVILDTSIFIDYLRQKDKKTLLLKVAEDIGKKNLCVSVITVQELYEGKSAAILEEEQAIEAILASLEIKPYTLETAKLAGEIARHREIDFADAAIAATAVVNGASLLTLNSKHFTGIKGLELYKI